jgi:hypothetical protein
MPGHPILADLSGQIYPPLSTAPDKIQKIFAHKVIEVFQELPPYEFVGYFIITFSRGHSTARIYSPRLFGVRDYVDMI